MRPVQTTFDTFLPLNNLITLLSRSIDHLQNILNTYLIKVWRRVCEMLAKYNSKSEYGY